MTIITLSAHFISIQSDDCVVLHRQMDLIAENAANFQFNIFGRYKSHKVLFRNGFEYYFFSRIEFIAEGLNVYFFCIIHGIKFCLTTSALFALLSNDNMITATIVRFLHLVLIISIKFHLCYGLQPSHLSIVFEIINII
jgi:hypothetical protein